jgi:hypothetical protein
MAGPNALRLTFFYKNGAVLQPFSPPFQTRVLEVPTTFVNENDGTWLMADWDRDGIPDLIFIKTSNTPNGHVEVHVATGKNA